MRSDSNAPVVILGAGLAGLSTAFHLARKRYVLVEREQRVGGHARSHRQAGYTFDITGHWLHLRDERVRQLFASVCDPAAWLEIERRTCVYSHGVLLPYPFQANLYGLPLDVVRECLVGFVEAREAAARDSLASPRTFEQFAMARFGRGITRHFFVPYNKKLWGVHPNLLTPAWVSRYIPIPDVDQIIGGAIGLAQEGLGYNTKFLYPKSGGIDQLPEAILRELDTRNQQGGQGGQGGQSEVHTSTDVDEIDPVGRRIKLSDARDWRAYDRLVATIPLPELVRVIASPPRDVVEAVARLRWVKWRYLDVATREPPTAGYHWVYVPEPQYPFFRVGVYSNAVATMAPPLHGSLYVELSDRSHPPQVPEILQALVSIRAIPSVESVVFTAQRDLEYAYVLFDDAYETATSTIFAWLHSLGIHSCGRYGAWIYNSMEDSMIAGMEAAAWAEAR